MIAFLPHKSDSGDEVPDLFEALEAHASDTIMRRDDAGECAIVRADIFGGTRGKVPMLVLGDRK